MNEHVSEDLGAVLRCARERCGLTLRDIADVTKLPLRTLAALENNRVDDLPGGIYRRAIVRNYASQVGLDPEHTLRAFLARHPDDVPTMATLLPAPPARAARHVAQMLVSAIGVLVPILAGVFYFVLAASGAEAPRHVADVTPAGAAAATRWETDDAAPPAGARDFDAVAMLVSVSSATRLQIVADGREVVARRLEAGDVVRLDLSTDVVLVGDDAGAVHFSINGQAGRSLGNSGTPLSARISRDDYQEWLITRPAR